MFKMQLVCPVAKVLAIAATQTGARVALFAAIATVGQGCAWQAHEVVLNALSVVQLLLIKGGIDRDHASPGVATYHYVLAVLCLVLQVAIAALCWD